MIDLDQLEREQLEKIVELIQGPMPARSVSENSQYNKTEDRDGDKILESLILWVDCIFDAIEDAVCPNEKLYIFWSQRSKFPQLTKAKDQPFECPELSALSEILVDLRRCSTNRYINRALQKQSKGRRLDHPKYKLLKDEVGKVYNLLRLFFVSSSDSCDAINHILKSHKTPIMSNDNIRKRASKNKGFPCYQMLFHDEDCEEENDLGLTSQELIDLRSSKILQHLICDRALKEFIRDTHLFF